MCFVDAARCPVRSLYTPAARFHLKVVQLRRVGAGGGQLLTDLNHGVGPTTKELEFVMHSADGKVRNSKQRPPALQVTAGCVESGAGGLTREVERSSP